MTRRPTGSILVFLVLIGGVAIGEYFSRVAPLTPLAVPGVAVKRDRQSTPDVGTVLPQAGAVHRPLSQVGTPAELSIDASATLAEQVALQLLGNETTLALRAEQWADFASVALNTQAIRHAYEASIAQVSSLEPGRYRLEIPAYPEAGDALRARFYADLHGKLGGPTADRIYAEMGHSLEAHFSGFGSGGQTLEI